MVFLWRAEEQAADVAEAVKQIEQAYNRGRFEILIDELPDRILSFGIRVLGALVLFFIGRKIIRMIANLTERSMKRAGVEITVGKFAKYLVRAVGYVLLAILILSVAGVQPTAFATIASSLTVALGLALQGSLGNFAGGLLIMILRPFKVGDYIIEDTHKNEGAVRKIGLVYTELVTLDSRVIMVPNGYLANSSMTNVTAQEKRQLDLKVGISYESDLKKAKELMLSLVKKHPRVITEDEHFVYVSELGDSAVILGLRCWIKTSEYWKCLWDLNEQIKLTFDKEGISIPYGQLDVHVKN